MAMSGGIDGYLADDIYPSTFQRDFSPCWIDAMLRHKGWVPPRNGRAPFRLLDLGCGDGFGLTALAAAYPEGTFVGIDGLPEHVARGETLARRLGLSNITFRCAYFADVAAPAQADFDYVTGQGLLAWVSEENRRHVYRIAGDHLRDGAAACLGYNSMPGWREMMALQKLILVLAKAGEGSSNDRFCAALAEVQAISEAGTATLPPALMEWVAASREKLPDSYFPHEYLNDHWQPLWSADVMTAMAALGFAYLAPARIERLREDFVLRGTQRARLQMIRQPIARETAADIMANCSFRVDIFGCGVPAAGRPQQTRLDGWWAATTREAEADYSCSTRAGTLRFDNAAAHAILRALEAGPGTLRQVWEEEGSGTVADVLNAADALFMAGCIVPAEPPADTPAAAPINAELAARRAAGTTMKCEIGRHGALPLDAIVSSTKASERETEATVA